MRHVGTIRSIHRYPVKSMAGEELASAELGWHGIDGDRRYAFVRAGNMSGMPWLTASTLPELLRYRARLAAGEGNAPPRVSVRIPGGADVAVESDSLREKIAAKHGAAVTLIRMRNGVFDETPISVISTTTIERLAAETGCALDPRRFRPNLLVEPAGPAPLDETLWIGKKILFGDHAGAPAVTVTMHDVRCVMVNFDPETAAADARVFRSIARLHESCAGVYASVARVGTVSPGDRIYLEDQ